MYGFAPLAVDTYVRKHGRSTGTTWGFVAGVHSGWRPRGFKTSGLTEFYVLEEKRMRDNRFGRKGDSGAAVINDKGGVVGLVFAALELTDVQLIAHPRTDKPDSKKTAEQREDDGGVDLNGMWTTTFTGTRFILVEALICS
jgi:hypothetical protein